jgi:hypothetical protein
MYGLLTQYRFIKMKVYYKTYYRCSTQDDLIIGLFGDEVDLLVNSYTFDSAYDGNGNAISTPAWFNEFNFFPIGSCGWTIAPPSESDTTYRFVWDVVLKTGETVQYMVELIMLNYCSVAINNIQCSQDGLKILSWLNRQGGWSYFTFNGKTTYSVKIPDGKTYKNSDYIQRYSERPDVYTAELVTTGDTPQAALDLLESLKTSIQAYLIEDYDTDAPIYKPIQIQDGDFTKRKTGDKIFDVAVNFIYSEQVQIQTG